MAKNPMDKNCRLNSTPETRMRHPEYARDDDWIVSFLRHTQVGHIATRWNEQPYIIPTLFWYDPERHEIYFHSNITGQVRANVERHPEVCFEASQAGELLPSNVALEFGIQYESVIAFGKIRILKDEDERLRGLYGLIEKYFPGLEAETHYRPITEQELELTSVYAISIESWSGKRNWHEQSDQTDQWAAPGED